MKVSEFIEFLKKKDQDAHVRIMIQDGDDSFKYELFDPNLKHCRYNDAYLKIGYLDENIATIDFGKKNY